MDRVSHLKPNRTLSLSNRTPGLVNPQKLEMAALILAAGDFDESNLSAIGCAAKRGNSKALLSVGNKPQLFHSIKMLEAAGFMKDQIFVAIEKDDLIQYCENERIVPIESRIPDGNMLLVRDPKSSADTLAEGLLKLSQQHNGLPAYVLVVYVDVLSCERLLDIAQFNRMFDPAFISVYGPKAHTLSQFKALPGGDEAYKTKTATKLTFMGCKEPYKNVRKLHFAIDTESMVNNDTVELSKRLLAADDHMEVISDLDDQGVFLFRRDVCNYIITNSTDRDSIRGSLIPSILKQQHIGTKSLKGLESPFSCYAVVDNFGTWRLNSLHNYVEAHRSIIAATLLKNRFTDKRETGLKQKKLIDACYHSIVGENLHRFNEKENLKTAAEFDFHGEALDGSTSIMSRVIIRKSIIGDYCKLEYEANPQDRKSDISIQNSIIMSNVTINSGCRVNNCIISSNATIGFKCNLTNCIIGQNAQVASLTTSKDITIGFQYEDEDIVIE